MLKTKQSTLFDSVKYFPEQLFDFSYSKLYRADFHCSMIAKLKQTQVTAVESDEANAEDPG